MKLASALLLLAIAAHADDLKTIAAPDLKSPLSSEWKVAKGTWEPKDGVLTGTELLAEKHAAVLWHQVPMQTGTVTCEFMLETGKTLILGCDGDRHVGRIVITPQALQVRDDSTEVKGKTPSTLLATTKISLKPGEWHTLTYEWSGDRMTGKVDGAKVEGTSANLAKKKVRWWFAIGGGSVKLRNIKVSGVKD